MRATMDLCVSCKGCKRDCPTGVDMARMKIEFLHQWQQKRGLGFKEKLIATLPQWAPWAARLPWLFNLRNHLPGAAKLTEKLLGFSAQRSLPTWRRDTFLGSQANYPDAAVASRPIDSDGQQTSGKHVVLFADSFNNYFEAENL